MKFIGIDLHKKRSRYVVLSQDGRVIEKRSIPSTPEAERSLLPIGTRVIATLKEAAERDTPKQRPRAKHLLEQIRSTKD